MSAPLQFASASSDARVAASRRGVADRLVEYTLEYDTSVWSALTLHSVPSGMHWPPLLLPPPSSSHVQQEAMGPQPTAYGLPSRIVSSAHEPSIEISGPSPAHTSPWREGSSIISVSTPPSVVGGSRSLGQLVPAGKPSGHCARTTAMITSRVCWVSSTPSTSAGSGSSTSM